MVGRWNLNSLILHGCTLNVSSFLVVLFILPSQPLTDRHPTNLSHSVITHEQVWLYLSDQLAWSQKLCPGGWGERRRGRYKWWSDGVRKSQVLPVGRCQLPATENRWQTHPLREKHCVPVDGDIAGNTGFYFASMRKSAMKTLWEEVLQAIKGQWPGHPMCIWDLGKLSTWNTNLLWNNQLFGWSSCCIQVWTQGPQVQKGHRHFS